VQAFLGDRVLLIGLAADLDLLRSQEIDKVETDRLMVIMREVRLRISISPSE
jgi:hypothetical protein